MIFAIDPDNGFKKIARLDMYIQSITWNEKMLSEDGGDFTIVLHGDGAKDYIYNDIMIINTATFKVGIITSIKSKISNGEIDEITITGKMLESILSRRRIKGQMNLKGPVKQIVTDILNKNVIKSAVSASNIKMKINFVGNITDNEQTYIAQDGQKVSTVLNALCMTLNWFYYFTIEDEELVLNFKEVEDKTHILFASDDTNLYDASLLETSEAKANAIIVKGDYVSKNRPYIHVAHKGVSGIHWIEEFQDESSNLDSEDVEGDTYVKALKQKGKEGLAVYQIRRAFDSAVVDAKYTYPDELFLGDIVTVDVGGITEPQRIVSYFYTLSSSGKEEISFTLSQVPVVVSDINSYIVMEDLTEDEILSDATSTGANKTGGAIEIVGPILCIDNEQINGTIQKLTNNKYRINIYTWNPNPEILVKEEDTNNYKLVVDAKPFSGKIYFGCPFDILSYIPSETDTVDIDNFDGTKTRITISSAYKGVLYRDYFEEGYPLAFENPTEENAGDKIFYEYQIESENLNFNFSIDVYLGDVKDEIPIKKYGKTYPVALYTSYGRSPVGMDFHNNILQDDWIADEGDYICLKCHYSELIHTNDPNMPYTTGPMEYKEFYWYYKQDEKVTSKKIRLPEGLYDIDKSTTSNFFSSFKKLNYLKKYGTTNKNWIYGEMYPYFGPFEDGSSLHDTGVNPNFLVKQNPAFDTWEEVDDVKWQWFGGIPNNVNVINLDAKRPADLGVWICTCTNNDGGGALSELCNDKEKWQNILNKQAAGELEF